MFTRQLSRALPLAVAVLVAASSVALADPGTGAPTPTSDQLWTVDGFHIAAPTSMWPMLSLLHQYKFDWELYSVQARPTPLQWSTLSPGVYGQYSPSQNVVKLSTVLQNESVELGTAYLAHELTHLNDDLNGRLGDLSTDACYAAETRAFVNEANFWQMVNGPQGKTTNDILERRENLKMFAFVGNSAYADLVIRTTPSYEKQCGRDLSSKD
jgi:hypothetical protein